MMNRMRLALVVGQKGEFYEDANQQIREVLFSRQTSRSFTGYVAVSTIRCY
ncbi:hypothetical protein VIBNISO65_1490007 [Vibrio nigripulchritudo SO65]|nr:hypothetical protein VIBNIAM115_930007 [Vibrio nigripulchritudo AM115]CCN44262.1 hypothetical protein VIBNIFTn2_730033 [Vibrio nigripulchritudo FTn2]CCN67746.1 hypothetical protein VIBNIPon4_860033 [Vibrio nigripulchritudo POn4]CCN76003.1 hypothetical protein VIBNISO65_1490007 [Vibrio nigripulchritudo SO65]